MKYVPNQTSVKYEIVFYYFIEIFKDKENWLLNNIIKIYLFQDGEDNIWVFSVPELEGKVGKIQIYKTDSFFVFPNFTSIFSSFPKFSSELPSCPHFSRLFLKFFPSLSIYSQVSLNFLKFYPQVLPNFLGFQFFLRFYYSLTKVFLKFSPSVPDFPSFPGFLKSFTKVLLVLQRIFCTQVLPQVFLCFLQFPWWFFPSFIRFFPSFPQVVLKCAWFSLSFTGSC